MNGEPATGASPPAAKAGVVTAQRLREAREFLGLTQTDVASVFDVSQADIADIESGERTVTGVELERFRRLYRRPVTWLRGEPDGEPVLNPSIHEAIDGLSERDQETVLRFAEFLTAAGQPGKPYIEGDVSDE